MDEKPKRRWFRFRMSTILILTAIVAWAMALKPAWRFHYSRTTTAVITRLQNEFSVYTTISGETGTTPYRVGLAGPQSAVYPLLAVATFLAWKGVLAIVARRHAHRST